MVITVNQVSTNGIVHLKHGKISDYFSEYVTEEEFYSVMHDVANIFNEIGTSDEKGYTFYAHCIEATEIGVHMIIND